MRPLRQPAFNRYAASIFGQRVTSFQKQGGRWPEVTRRDPCRICVDSGNGKGVDWCQISPDRTIAHCMRVSAGAFKEHSGGGWLHRLDEKGLPNSANLSKMTLPNSAKSLELAPITERHAFYHQLLDRLDLTECDATRLKARGLSEEAIEKGLYASVRNRGQLLDFCAEASKRHDLSAIPGCYRVGDAWHFEAYVDDLLIPSRDVNGRIQAIKRRQDREPKYLFASCPKKGFSPTCGNPWHYAAPWLVSVNNGLAIVTEGELKADVIAERLQIACIGLSGVNGFRDTIGLRLRGDLSDLSHVLIAYDADLETNEIVRRAQLNLMSALQTGGLLVSIVKWDPKSGKGLDDVIAAGGEVWV